MSPGGRENGSRSIRSQYRSVVATFRERPWTLGVGWLAAVPAAVVFAVAFGLVGLAIETLLPHFLLAVGLAGVREGVFSKSIVAPDVIVQVARGALGLAGLLLAFEVVRGVVAYPATAVVYRVDADRRAGRETDLRRVARELLGPARRTLLGGLAVRLAAFVAFVCLLPVAVAVYLSLGTVLEAVAWAVDLPWQARTWILVFSAVVGLVAARRIATAALLGADPDAVLDPDLGPRAAIRRSVAAFLDDPRQALRADAAASLPVVLAVVVPVAVLAVGDSLDAGPYVLLAVVPVAVFGLATAVPASALYRVRSASSRPTPGDADGSIRDRVPLGTVAVAVLLVGSLAVGGGWVRSADVGPASGDAAATFPDPTAADPSVAVRRSLDALGRTSIATERRTAARTVYPANDTSDPWRDGGLWTARYEPGDRERVVIWSYASADEPREWRGEGVYQGETAYARASVQYRADAPDQGRVRNATWWSLPHRPEPVPVGGLVTYNANGSVAEAEWRVVDRTDDRVVYGTTNRSMVTRFTDVYRVRGGRVRVWLDRSTGRLRRVEARAARTADADDDPGYGERRVTVTVRGYGDTEVRRPRGTAKGPFEHLVDVLYYWPR